MEEAAAAEEAVLAVQLEAATATQELDWAVEAMEYDRRHRKRPADNTNWASPENQAVLAPAVKGWLDGTAEKEGRSMVAWASPNLYLNKSARKNSRPATHTY